MDVNRLSFNVIRIALLVGTVVLVLLVLLAKPVASASSEVVREDAAAAAAVRAMASHTLPVERQIESIPVGFENEHGYLPIEVAGYPVDPQGNCTSPVRLPASFDAPCQAHDLGYDLLRYAASVGHPLGPWAREALDSAFANRLALACEAEPGIGCRAAASAAVGVVRLNSLRQDYGVPVHESPADVLVSLFTKADRA